MPGDRLIAECIYDSSSRNAITLGEWLVYIFCRAVVVVVVCGCCCCCTIVLASLCLLRGRMLLMTFENVSPIVVSQKANRITCSE